jgi:hypothetical protein
MFTFKNPNTPIIASGTSVLHNGETFTITSRVSQYFYKVDRNGETLGYVPMGGNGHNWQAGVDAVKALIEQNGG